MDKYFKLFKMIFATGVDKNVVTNKKYTEQKERFNNQKELGVRLNPVHSSVL